MKFFSLNKSDLSKQVFDGVQEAKEASYPYNAKKLFKLLSKMMKIKSDENVNCDENFKIDKFSDGELCPIFKKSIRDQHVFIMADGHDSENIVKLLLTIDAAKRSGAKKITLIYPYMPYSRQDKNDHVRSSIGAKMMADILQAAGITRIICIELHAPAIQGFFNIPIIHLNGNKIFTKYMKNLDLENVTICSPDHGALKRNTDFAKNFPDWLAAVIDKKRKKPNEVASMEITGEENIVGRNIVSVDDMGDTLGTLSKAANLVMEKGALSFRAFLTHPVLSGNALRTLYFSKITELVVSDTIVSVYDKHEKYYEIMRLEAEAILSGDYSEFEKALNIDDSFEYEKELILDVQTVDEVLEILKTRRTKLTIVSCAKLLIKSINSLINKKNSINDINTKAFEEMEEIITDGKV